MVAHCKKTARKEDGGENELSTNRSRLCSKYGCLKMDCYFTLRSKSSQIVVVVVTPRVLRSNAPPKQANNIQNIHKFDNRMTRNFVQRQIEVRFVKWSLLLSRNLSSDAFELESCVCVCCCCRIASLKVHLCA